MDLKTRRKALRAAAKVTLSASLFACGGMTAAEDAGVAEKTGNGDEETLVVSDAESHLQHDAREAAVGCPSTEAGEKVATETFTCCLGIVGSEVGDGGQALPDAALASSATLGCCAAIVSYVNANWQGYEKAESVLRPCCDTMPDKFAGACDPWGPPVPPSMDFVPRMGVA